MKDYTLAEIAYETYCMQAGRVSLMSGEALPEFGKLSKEIQEAWYEAAMAVAWEVGR